jgi:hypothetical protein
MSTPKLPTPNNFEQFPKFQLESSSGEVSSWQNLETFSNIHFVDKSAAENHLVAPFGRFDSITVLSSVFGARTGSSVFLFPFSPRAFLLDH